MIDLFKQVRGLQSVFIITNKPYAVKTLCVNTALFRGVPHMKGLTDSGKCGLDLPCRGNTDGTLRSGGLDTIPSRKSDRKEVRAVPNLLLVITGVCIIAYVLRETLDDLQKKMKPTMMDKITVEPISRAKSLLKARCYALIIALSRLARQEWPLFLCHPFVKRSLPSAARSSCGQIKPSFGARKRLTTAKSVIPRHQACASLPMLRESSFLRDH